MQQVGGVWLPDHDQHTADWMRARNERVDGRLTYQHHKLAAALGYVREWRVAVDVGAHAGLWSMHLAPRFDRLLAFEPVPAHAQCWRRNVAGGELHEVALAAEPGEVDIVTAPGDSGGSAVGGKWDPSPADMHALVPARRFDDLFPGIEGVDFVKVDVEGYELFALQGMEQMLRRCRPVLVVEQKPGPRYAARYGLGATAAVEWLRGLGYAVQRVLSGDYILA